MVIDSKHTSVSGETSHSSEEPGIVGSNLTLEEGWLDEASAILLDVEGRDALDQVNDLAKLAQDQQASSVTVSIFDQIDVDFGRTFAALAERDIDFLLLEEFQVNPDFVRWFCNEIGLSGIEPGGAWHSVFDADGETDLLLRVYENHDKIGILIENKVAASEQPDQGKRYYVRGKRMVNQGKLTSFKTVICAPEVYLNGHDTKHYDHYISYEKIMIWFARQSDQRAQWRCHVVRQAIDQSRRGYTMVKDENITKFQLKYWTYLTKNHPRLLMNKPGDRGPRSTWIIFKGRGFPKNVEFNHKFNQQRLELGFNQTEKEKLLAARTDWPDDIIIDQRGAQATISLGTPKIDIRDDFDQQIPAIEEVFKAAERLAQYASILVQPPASLNDDGHSPATKRLDTLDERSTPKKDENINSGTKKQFRHERFVGEWTDQQVLTPVTPIDERQSHRDSNYGINPGSLEDRAVGCLLGLAVGDALGAPVEFKSPGSFEPITGLRAGGPFNLKAGEWTDDTSMALSLADTLLEDPELKDFSKLLQRWVNWYKQGAYSHTGTCFDIGNQTRNALEAFVRGKTPTLTDSAGNGGIMRLAPVAVRHHNHPNLAASIARKQSELTHNNQVCTDNAAQLANILVSLISHTEKDSHLFLPPLLDHKLIKSTGYVVDTLNAAGWAFMTTNSFEKATLKAVNLGGDSDTIGAVTGQIAGAAYGLSAIPRDWLNQLAWRDQIIEIARKLFMAETATA